jgi:DNA-binding MurR/RpiR family transcriptional regulator
MFAKDMIHGSGDMTETSDLVTRLQAALPVLSPSQRRVAEYLLQTYPEAALLTADKVAEGAGVSEATVIRLAMALGYEGYNDMQQDVRQDLGRTVHKLRRATERPTKGGSILTTVMEQEVANIRAMAEIVSPESVDRVVDFICEARHIYVSGARSSWFLAQYFGHVLANMLGNVTTLQPALPQVIFDLTAIGPEDLVIVCTFPRYTIVTMEIARFAKERGAKLLCFTDSTACPAAAIADVTFCAPIDSVHLMDSYTASMALMHAVVGGVNRKANERVLDTLGRLEETYAQFDIFYTYKP